MARAVIDAAVVSGEVTAVVGSGPIRLAGRPVGAQEAFTRTGRLVHRGHFAFMRAIVQGLPVGENFHRYLGNEYALGSTRSGATTIAWLRREFVVAARKQSRYGTARLLRIDVSQIPAPERALPDIDDWAIENGWADFGENEILKAYQDAHAADAGERLMRRTRLMEKQLEALRWLEELMAQEPQAGDACSAWFSDTLQRRLTGVGILTLAQLVDRINGIGRQWYRTIDGIGPTKAARLVAWLGEHGQTKRLSVGRHVAIKRSRLYREELAQVVPTATAIRPLEKFLVPAELDGRAGRYRQPQVQCLLSARNDYDAILAWLQSKRSMTPQAQAEQRARRRGKGASDPDAPLAWLEVLSHTQRSCRKEAERFLLWAILERGKPLSSMATEDCIAYRDFLADPQSTDTWCGPRGRERWSPLWRPFEGPLSIPAQHLAISQLRNLYAFLADQNYLMGNPWTGVALPRKAQQGINAGRSFTEKQWDQILDQLALLKIGPEKKLRLTVALTLLYTTGLRLSEAVHARVDDLTWVEYPAEKGQTTSVAGWELQVVGKGEKLRDVVVPQSVIADTQAYLASRDLPVDLQQSAAREAYLLAPLVRTGVQPKNFDAKEDNPKESRGSERLAANTLYTLLKDFFGHCSQALAKSDPRAAERLQCASTHWLRHSHASHAIARGVPIEVAQASLGHASLATTTVYVTTEKARRMRAMQDAWN